MRKYLSLIILVIPVWALANVGKYDNLCPAISSLQFHGTGTSIYGYWTGTNSDGASFQSNKPHNPPQPGDPQKGIVEGLNSSLTDFVAISNTMRCVYIIKNTQGYNLNTSLYNHWFYHQCPNGDVIPDTKSCN